MGDKLGTAHLLSGRIFDQSSHYLLPPTLSSCHFYLPEYEAELRNPRPGKMWGPSLQLELTGESRCLCQLSPVPLSLGLPHKEPLGPGPAPPPLGQVAVLATAGASGLGPSLPPSLSGYNYLCISCPLPSLCRLGRG